MENEIGAGITINNGKLIKYAFILAYFTIFYNIIEGAVSVYFGLEDGTLSLFGFGVDSFVEVLSGIGIWHMLIRIKKNGNENKDDFEKTALKVTGVSFYLLTAGLLLSSIINLLGGHKPETTFWGILISLISIFTMWLLIKLKMQVGVKMNSRAIIADADCTKTCMYLSVILLISSLGYQLFGVGLIDSLGAMGISYFSYKEGKEAFEKVKSGNYSCGCKEDNR